MPVFNHLYGCARGSVLACYSTSDIQLVSYLPHFSQEKSGKSKAKSFHSFLFVRAFSPLRLVLLWVPDPLF